MKNKITKKNLGGKYMLYGGSINLSRQKKLEIVFYAQYEVFEKARLMVENKICEIPEILQLKIEL